MGANKAQHEIERSVAMTARQRKAVGVSCTASHLQCTDWRSVFSRLPMRDCTSWICLLTHTHTRTSCQCMGISTRENPNNTSELGWVFFNEMKSPVKR